VRLRDYQLRALDAIRLGWDKYRRQLIVVCTGGGKTIIFAGVAAEAVKAGGRVLVLAHTEELIDQAIDKIQRVTGIACGKEKAEFEGGLNDQIVVASVQTLCRPLRLLSWAEDHFGLVIVDECHHALATSYRKILDHFAGARVLGVTATADRGDKRNLAEIFENVAAEFNLIDAVKQGWLVRPIVKTVPVQIDMKGIKTTRSNLGYDYDVQEVTHRLEPLIEGMCKELVKEIGRRKTVVYLPSIHLSQMAARATALHGVRTQFVSGECADRAEKMQRLRDSKVQVTFNAQLLIEGFDDDSISCISVWRPTKIRSLLAQCIGRGARPLTTLVPELDQAASPEERRFILSASAKPDMLILDFLWLTEKLDLIRPTDLVVTNFEIAQHAKKLEQQGDLMDLAEYAARDYLKTLEEAVRKNARRKARVIDPLAFAVAVHDEEIETYEPSSRWEMNKPSEAQAKLLTQFGINPLRVTSSGYASKLLDRLLTRRRLNLCSVQQMTFLDRLGIHDAALLSHDEAKAKITARLSELKARRPAKPAPQLQMAWIEGIP
jgi:superfamily II DNA or RNA helicase